MDTERTLADWLRWQESLHPRAIEMGLERVREVALRLGLLRRQINTLTIAGTNGKGSSATLMAGIYSAAGYRVGLYTSPHLMHYNERVTINGVAVSDADLCRAFAAIEQARHETLLTYFEFGTLAALWLFRQSQVDVQVLEVGLGGRLDAVNIVDADCALITNIGLDHTDWLGPDRESIAREKAGILRVGKPAVYVDEQPTKMILQTAEALASRLMLWRRDFDIDARQQSWNWRGLGREFKDLPLPGLDGITQLRNAAGVIAVVELMQDALPVSESAIHAALPKLKLPGRFQRLGRVILDVAHNAEAASVLADNLCHEKISGRVFLILAMLSDKPVEAFAKNLAPMAHEIAVAGLPGPRGLTGDEMCRKLQHAGIKAECYQAVSDAFSNVQKKLAEGDVIVVTGSFLTVAAVAEMLHE